MKWYTRISLTAGLFGLILSTNAAIAQDITAYESDGDAWLAMSKGTESCAFDSFYPGIAGGKDDVSDPITVINLDSTTLTIQRFGGGGALRDASTSPAVSDAALYIRNTVGSRWTFDPPIYGLYTYYGSAGIQNTMTMELYSDNVLIGETSRFGGGLDIYAVGHGFLSDMPIDRIDFISEGPDAGVLIGAYVGLYSGEASLGRTYIDGYHGPNGSNVEYDFAVSTQPPTDFDLTVDPLISGSAGHFQVNNAQPDTKTWLVYSLEGIGETDVPELGVTLSLAQPIQAGRSRMTDGTGTVEWSLPIPGNAHGLDIWFQAVQNGEVSGVVETWIN